MIDMSRHGIPLEWDAEDVLEARDRFGSYPEFLMSAVEADTRTLRKMRGRWAGTYRDAMVNEPFARDPESGEAHASNNALDFRVSNGNGTGKWGQIEAMLDVIEGLMWHIYGEISKHQRAIEGGR